MPGWGRLGVATLTGWPRCPRVSAEGPGRAVEAGLVLPPLAGASAVGLWGSALAEGGQSQAAPQVLPF